MLQKIFPNHFKINYQFREYHFTPDQYKLASPLPPEKTKVNILRIHKADNILGLVLAFYVSFALSARKTALILRSVYNIKVSYQTVLNYAQTAAYYAHQFNLKHKGSIDNICVGDETYIKIKGLTHYVWFVISSKVHSIVSYHLSSTHDTVQAVAAINETIRTAKPDQPVSLITDGFGSYVEAIQFLNKNRQSNKIKHIKVIGLENKDAISAEFRPFKQMIERLNRTFKNHIKPSAGFNSFNGAIALIVLFVSHYNFLRPHMTLNYRTPLPNPQLDKMNLIQAKWVRLISMML